MRFNQEEILERVACILKKITVTKNKKSTRFPDILPIEKTIICFLKLFMNIKKQLLHFFIIYTKNFAATSIFLFIFY